MTSLPLAFLLPFVAALLVPLLYRLTGRRLGWSVAVVPLLLFTYFASLIGKADGISASWSWIPLLDINLSFTLNGMSLLFSLLITGIGTLVVVYSVYYLGAREDLAKFYIYLLLFMGGMLGVVLSDNLIFLYISWELTSVSSFLLIGFWHTRSDSREGAQKALLITVAGGFALLVASLLVYTLTGTFEFQRLLAHRDAIVGNPLYTVIVLLIFLGAFTKSAQAPFHIWLPGAMAAPTPVSAYLHSATMVKAGIFLLAKFAPLLGGTALWYYGIAAAGAVTVFLGALLAVRQTDLKALLAFSTVSQLGLILPMFALGTDEGALAGAAHIVNHATFKGALFLLVGIIDHQTHTRDIRRLSGLRRKMPWTAALMGIAALSMAGVWPLNGFVSKELIFAALLHPPYGPNIWTWGFVVLAVAGSVLTVVYSGILAHRIHFGRSKSGSDITEHRPGADLDHAAIHDPPFGMLAGPFILCALVVLFGIVPSLAEATLYRAAAGTVLGHLPHVHVHALPALGTPLLMSLIALVGGVALYTVHRPFAAFLSRLRYGVTADGLYRGVLASLQRVADLLNQKQMTGFLRDYIAFMVGALVLTLGATLIATHALAGLDLNVTNISVWEGAVVSIMIASAFTVVAARRRLTAILALGAVGAMVSLFFVLMRAPDLALTQLMVEAISTVLILLAFGHLPALKRESATGGQRAVNLIVAIGAGVAVSLVALAANGTQFFPSIAWYYIQHSLDLGGGKNIVNVILVDFRGFDTMGEITVLSIAALSVRALIRLRPSNRDDKPERESDHA